MSEGSLPSQCCWTPMPIPALCIRAGAQSVTGLEFAWVSFPFLGLPSLGTHSSGTEVIYIDLNYLKYA